MKRRITIATFLVLAAGCSAGGEERALSLLMGPEALTYTGDVMPGRDGSPRILQNDLRWRQTVARNGPNFWTASARADRFEMNQSPVIPETGLVVPSVLGSLQAGGGFEHHVAERRFWAVGLDLGSASDRLFHTIHETEIQLLGRYEIPCGSRNAWIFALQYSNNRPFLNNVPLPGFAYLWNDPVPGLTAVVGFPFAMVHYAPSPNWSAGFTIFGPTNITVELTRRLVGPLRGYIGYERNPQLWLRSGREDNKDRLIFDQKRGKAGLRLPLGGPIALDVSCGWAYDRRFFESTGANRTDVPRADLPAQWFASWKLTARL